MRNALNFCVLLIVSIILFIVLSEQKEACVIEEKRITHVSVVQTTLKDYCVWVIENYNKQTKTIWEFCEEIKCSSMLSLREGTNDARIDYDPNNFCQWLQDAFFDDI